MTTTRVIRRGNAVLVRTVTHYWVGRIVAIYRDMIVLSDASWVAATRRYGETLTTGQFDEVERIPNGRAEVARGAIVDVVDWAHTLPVETR